jgi:peptidyl-prolyl cis-trans isomerase D
MLHIFRESVGRYVAIAILALIAVTFVFFGIDFTTSQSSYAAKVNGDSIPLAEFERELQATQNQYQQLYRVELDDELRLALRREVIDQMVMQEALIQQARDAGYRVSDARLIAEIRSAEAFQAGGQFSADVYRSRLAAEGYTPALFEAEQRQRSFIVEIENAITDSAFLTPREFRRGIELYYERREIAWALFPAAAFRDRVEITDEAVAEYHAGNGERFMTPEAVDIEFIVLSLEDVAAGVEIDEDDLRERYEADVESFTAGQERRVSHILIEVEGADREAAEAEAAAVVERLEAGEEFAALAAEVSDDTGTAASGGDLGWVARGVLPDAFDAAVFALEPGDIDGPVETEFGFHVMRLEEARAGDPPPFEQMRDEIREQLANDRAYSDYLDRANAIGRAAFDAGPNLADVANEFGLTLETLEGLTRVGDTDRFLEPAPVIEQAFDEDLIGTGYASRLIELGQDTVVVLRVIEHHLPEPQPLETVADEIRGILTQEAASELAADAAAAFRDELDPAAVTAGTQELPALASTHGGSWNEAIWIDRDSADVPAAIREPVFAATRPTEGEVRVLDATVNGDDAAVILLTAVEPGDPENIAAAERDQGREQLRAQVGETEMNAYAADARQRATVRVPDEVLNPDL